MPDITGNCKGCQRTFQQLDILLQAAINCEVEMGGDHKLAARMHVLAAVASWWMDRMLASFPNRKKGIETADACLSNVYREQNIPVLD